MPLALVTGCTGFVGSELCKQLLARGFAVRGQARSAAAPRAQQLLSALGGQGDLQIVEADLLVPGTLDTALQGVEYVFHVASPFAIVVDDPQRQLIEPAVHGTRHVLDAAAKHKATLKRVVVTSSVAAVHDCHQKQVPKRPDGKWSEEEFNEVSTIEGAEGGPPEAYWVSKVQAEKEAWAKAKEHGLDVVTILPEFIMGPVLTAAAAESSLSAGFMKGFLEAPNGEVPSGTWLFSDVRDVAAAHVLAATQPSASGRYIVSQPVALSARHVTDILKARIDGLAVPDGKDEPVKDNIDNTKAQTELGLKLTPVADTLTDMANSLIALGFATPKRS